MSEFDPNPRFEDHMCHFRPWSDHFKESDGDIGILARMLGYAWDEVERLRIVQLAENKACAKFQYAFVTGEEPQLEDEAPLSLKASFEYIKKLNERRAKNLFVWPR